MTRNERALADANARVAGWPSLAQATRAAISDAVNLEVVTPLKSGGFLVDVGESFPIWRCDMGAVRRLLLERALAAADS